MLLIQKQLEADRERTSLLKAGDARNKNKNNIILIQKYFKGKYRKIENILASHMLTCKELSTIAGLAKIWQAGRFSWHAAFTAVPIFYFLYPIL
jgi:hypothetical protein